MFKFLKGVVGGSGSGPNNLPYYIAEPYCSSWGSWAHSRGSSKDDGSPVSIFSLSGSNANDGLLAAGRNGVKRLRTVRHPNILSFLHSMEAETFVGSTAKVTIYIVTEPVMPLSEKIRELGLEGTQRDEYYAWGLNQITKAVSFLNNDCKLVHGNVCLASVVVTRTLDWKLHAFDVLSEFDGNNEASMGSMLQYEWLVASEYKSMEFLKSDWATIRKSPPWAIDSWGLGCLIYELFSGMKLSKTEELRNTASIPKVLPTIVKLFTSNDRSIRVGLLQHIDQYGKSLSAQIVDEQVYPHVATGFSDTSAFLREMTLKSMLVLAPKLSQRTLSGSLLKYLSKLQVDEEPAIRTNTTILIGNIASYLNDGTRKRVLINAFTVRALRDTFSPARGAGVMALCATSSYYDVTEIATRILPNIVVLTIDPDSDVQSKAFQAVDQFLQIVKQNHEKVCYWILLTFDFSGAFSFFFFFFWGVFFLDISESVGHYEAQKIAEMLHCVYQVVNQSSLVCPSYMLSQVK
ncbi:N-terminal kinase-like protein isoform X6 [Camellia sinensis]|uniref:N-terminal kinase-like protein isoform X6 n=1 Tax=Camellia sinensis TaxID=4442 RepID=UPI001036BCBF|nr:N-terminal kinase-like protein isoform X6 [Camellia sinensis]